MNWNIVPSLFLTEPTTSIPLSEIVKVVIESQSYHHTITSPLPFSILHTTNTTLTAAPLTHTTRRRRQRHTGYGSTQQSGRGLRAKEHQNEGERERSKLKPPVYNMSAVAAAVTGNSYCSRQFVKLSPLFVPALYKPSR
ncbi:hypothetical protein ACFE04_027216 [Oxalis oulophora]